MEKKKKKKKSFGLIDYSAGKASRIRAVLLFSESENESVSPGGGSGSSEQQNEGRLLVNETALGL